MAKPESHPKQVNPAKAQRETKQRAKIKRHSEARRDDRKDLPPQKNGPEKQAQPSSFVAGDKTIGALKQAEAHSNHERSGQQPDNDQPEQVQPVLFSPQTIVQHPPAQADDQSDLLQDSNRLRYVSHESSSICARSAPLCPTIDRKICSSVDLLPSSPAIPARNSSMEPCATSRPW